MYSCMIGGWRLRRHWFLLHWALTSCISTLYAWPNGIPTANKSIKIFVSPSGTDTSIGSRAAPLASLKEAMKRIRGGNSNLAGKTIRLLPGVHRQAAPIELESIDSGTPGAPVLIEGGLEGKTIISGARPVFGWRPLPDSETPRRVPIQARGHLWVASLPRETWPDLPGLVASGFGRPLLPHCMELLFRHKCMPLARWPNAGFAVITSLDLQGPQRLFSIKTGGHDNDWGQEPDLWAYGYWNQDWRDSYERVQSSDHDFSTLRLLTGPVGSPKSGQRVRILNALSELDEPGEWYLDILDRKIYFWPTIRLKDGDIELTFLPTIINAKGVRNLYFRNIIFEGSRSTALSLKDVVGVTVQSCRFTNIGGNALEIEGSYCLINGCEILETGEGGIILSGGDRQTLLAGHLVARGNRISSFNRWGRCYRPAIQLAGVGNIADSNVINGAPHSAILFSGNDHEISCNSISNVCRESGDSGAIYSGRDWAARGTIINNNKINNVGGGLPQPVAGIYLDDQLSGVTVKNNQIRNVHIGILLGGGRELRIEENWFERCSVAIYIDARGLNFQRDWVANPKSPIRQSLNIVPYLEKPYSKYIGLATVLTNHPGAPVGVELRGNRSVGPMVMKISPDALPWISQFDNFGGLPNEKKIPSDCGTPGSVGP